jgi:hypothetical protein
MLIAVFVMGTDRQTDTPIPERWTGSWGLRNVTRHYATIRCSLQSDMTENVQMCHVRIKMYRCVTYKHKYRQCIKWNTNTNTDSVSSETQTQIQAVYQVKHKHKYRQCIKWNTNTNTDSVSSETQTQTQTVYQVKHKHKYRQCIKWNTNTNTGSVSSETQTQIQTVYQVKHKHKHRQCIKSTNVQYLPPYPLVIRFKTYRG